MQLVVKTFQNMFPAINPETIRIMDCKRVLLLQYEKVILDLPYHSLEYKQYSSSSLQYSSFSCWSK